MTSLVTRRGPERLISGVLTLVIVTIVAYVGWQLFGTNAVAAHEQHTVVGAMERSWTNRSGNATTDPLRMGEGFAVLRIPRFGSGFAVPVIQGISDSDLASGVGHFPDTVRPGQIGNFSVAGHRVTRGQPFSDFPALRAGDKVIVETRTDIYTYVLDNGGTSITVNDTDTLPIRSVPGKPNGTARRAMITLVTCSSALFRTPDRSVVHGHLVSDQPA